jgi:opacity protein-like surface antigen
MRKVLLLTSVACLFATNVFALSPYVAAKAKYVLTRDEIKAKGILPAEGTYRDEVFGGSAILGGRNGNFRMEIEYTKNAEARDKNVKVKTQALLFNLYYDIPSNPDIPLKPYIGGGIGIGHVDFDAGAFSKKDVGEAVHIGGGVNYKLDEHTYLDLGYRYIAYDDFDKEYRVGGYKYEKIEYRPHAHEIMFGVRYEF